ncbi:MAG: GNAT family N-acetyltransferase [Clostridia bacterium]|nr:GNAT family N-acetyltransferase [Clostridia bacterium]
MNIRLLRPEDREQAKTLWQKAFDDPPSFVDWFFANRYMPQWSAGAFEGDELISAIHGTPMELTAGQRPFPALMTSGVATVPRERGKGLMYETMRFLQAHAESRDIHALFNHPQRPGAYAHLGFRPSTYTKYWQGEGTFVSGEIAPFSEDKAFRVYSSIADRYAGFVRRDREAFRRKMADYASDGAKGFLLMEAGKAVGYGVYFEKEGVYAEEVLSLAGYGPILCELQRLAGSKPVSAKLPPDADALGEIRPQNVMLASEEIWQAMTACGRPCFCVDEY